MKQWKLILAAGIMILPVWDAVPNIIFKSVDGQLGITGIN